MSDDNVIHVAFKRVDGVEDEMVTAIKDLVYAYAGRITVATTLGVLEIVLNDLRREIL